MATPKEVLRIGGREVSVSNPGKVYFPETGYTKLDLVKLLPGRRRRGAARRRRPADGAQAVRGRRRRRGVLPEARAGEPAGLDAHGRRSRFPSGRTADEIVIDDAAGLAWVVNLGCIDLNPHPVRADDLDHPDELRVDLDPVPGVAVVADPRGGAGDPRGARGGRAWSAGRRRRARAGSTSTSGSSRAGRTRRSAAPRSPWPATSSGGCRTRPPRSGGRRSATASSSTTTRTPRTGPWPRPTRSGRCPTPGSPRRSRGTRCRPSRPRRSRSRRCRHATRRSATRAPGSTRRSARSRRCWS